MWGKAKIATAVLREWCGRRVPSVSTIGRIIGHLVRTGDIVPVPELRGKVPCAADGNGRAGGRRGSFQNGPRQIFQLDGMTVPHWGGRRTIKQLVAVDPISKRTCCATAYRRATARNADDFLDKLVREMPFEVKAMQVDGGAEFDQECRKLGIELRVLPPLSPKLNGTVERKIGTWFANPTDAGTSPTTWPKSTASSTPSPMSPTAPDRVAPSTAACWKSF